MTLAGRICTTLYCIKGCHPFYIFDCFRNKKFLKQYIRLIRCCQIGSMEKIGFMLYLRIYFLIKYRKIGIFKEMFKYLENE